MVNTKGIKKALSSKIDKQKFSRPEGAGNFDNMDDFNIVKSIALIEGTIQNEPTLDKHIANKFYVDANDFWKRVGTILSPKTAGDTIEIKSALSTFVALNMNREGIERDNYIGINGSDNLELAADEKNLGSASRIDFRLDGALRFYMLANELNLRSNNLTTTGEIHILADSKKLYFGAGDDAYFEYTGTDFNLVTDAVGASDFNVDCGTNKTLELQETVYRDINMAGYLLTRPTSNQPDVVSFLDEAGADTTIETYGFDINEKVHGGFELQHDYAEGTDLVFHVHWQGIAAPTGTDNVQWRLTYILMRDGETLNAAVTIDSTDTAFDTQYETVRTDFAAITGTNFKIGDQFMFTLERVASTGDAYAGDALIGTTGIHYQVNTIGSRTILTK